MNIVISGGTGGIGRETAIALATDKNNRILATGRNRSLLEDLEQGAVQRTSWLIILILRILQDMKKHS